MFKYKNAMISAAVVTMLAACGGGGGGNDNNTNPNTGGSDNNPPAQTQPTTDAKLTSTLVLASEGILFPQGADTIQLTYPQFNSNTPRTGTENTGGYGAYPNSAGTNSPLASLGVRVEPSATAADSKTGRLAFELQDQASLGAAQEILRIEIDNLTTAKAAAGTVGNGAITITPGTNSRAYIYARNRAGQQTGVVSIPAASSMISTSTVAATGETDIRLNIDAIVGAARTATTTSSTDAAVLGAVKDFSSTVTVPFEVSMTLSNANFARSGTTTPLTGKTITVGNRTGVLGTGGITGYYQRVAD